MQVELPQATPRTPGRSAGPRLAAPVKEGRRAPTGLFSIRTEIGFLVDMGDVTKVIVDRASIDVIDTSYQQPAEIDRVSCPRGIDRDRMPYFTRGPAFGDNRLSHTVASRCRDERMPRLALLSAFPDNPDRVLATAPMAHSPSRARGGWSRGG